MRFNTLTSLYPALRASTSRIPPIARSTKTIHSRLSTPSSSSPSALFIRCSSHVALNTLGPAPGSRKEKRRVGRGGGSKRGGHTSGRGHKGAKARGTGVPYRGFEGGQTPLYQKTPKRGFKNPMKKNLRGLPLRRVQEWIRRGRYDPSKPLTIHRAVTSGMVGISVNKHDGIKLIGKPYGKLPPLTIQLSKFSKQAGEAVEAAGGTPTAVFHNRLGLRQEIFPSKFSGYRRINAPGPKRRKDIEYYMNAEKWGYLSDPAVKEKFFRDRGWNPDVKRDRFTGKVRKDVPLVSAPALPAA